MLNHGGKRCKMRVGDNRLTIHTFPMLNICTFVYTMLVLILSVKFSLNPIPIWVYNSLIVFRAAHLSMLGDNDVSTFQTITLYRHQSTERIVGYWQWHSDWPISQASSQYVFLYSYLILIECHIRQRRSLWIVWLKTVQQRVHIKGDDTVTLNIVNVG